MKSGSGGANQPFSIIPNKNSHSPGTSDYSMIESGVARELSNFRIAVPQITREVDQPTMDDERDWCADSMAVELSSVESAAVAGFMTLNAGSSDKIAAPNSGLTSSRNTSILFAQNNSTNTLSANLSHENAADASDECSITSFCSTPGIATVLNGKSFPQDADLPLPLAPPSSPNLNWLGSSHSKTFPGSSMNNNSSFPSSSGGSNVGLVKRWWTVGAVEATRADTSLSSEQKQMFSNAGSAASSSSAASSAAVAGTDTPLRIQIPLCKDVLFQNGWQSNGVSGSPNSDDSIATSLFVEVRIIVLRFLSPSIFLENNVVVFFLCSIFALKNIQSNDTSSVNLLCISLFAFTVQVASLDGDGTYVRYGESCGDDDVSLRGDSIDGLDLSDNTNDFSSNAGKTRSNCSVPYYLAGHVRHRAGRSDNSPPDGPATQRRRYNTPVHEEDGSGANGSLFGANGTVIKNFSTERLTALYHSTGAHDHSNESSCYQQEDREYQAAAAAATAEGAADEHSIQDRPRSPGDHQNHHRNSSKQSHIPQQKAKYKRLQSRRSKESSNMSSMSSENYNVSGTDSMLRGINAISAGKRKRSDHHLHNQQHHHHQQQRSCGGSPVSALTNEQDQDRRAGSKKRQYLYSRELRRSGGGGGGPAGAAEAAGYGELGIEEQFYNYNSSGRNTTGAYVHGVYNSLSEMYSNCEYNRNGYSNGVVWLQQEQRQGHEQELAGEQQPLHFGMGEDIEMDGYDGASETG